MRQHAVRTSQRSGGGHCRQNISSWIQFALLDRLDQLSPGFGDLILARHTRSPADFEAYNGNYVGGAITGGVADLGQLFTRPVARLNPYTTPHPRLFFCSASTPPGGGVHGMCGYHAAQTVMRQLHARASVTLPYPW